jgi:hypothetical protein
MPKNKQLPINRSNKFFSGDDFDLEVDFGREWLEGDINIKVILFQVDRQKTNTSVNFKMDEAQNKSYNGDGSMRYKEHGNITFGIYQKHLDELGVEITYGDYIGYQEDEKTIKYYTVSNDGSIFSDNKHTINGYKGFYRTITCVPTSEDEFNG